MPKLRHIALAAEDPFVAAEFYKQAFDFTEVSRIDKSDDPKKSYGVFLSDGTLSLAVLHFGWDQGPGAAAFAILGCSLRMSTRWPARLKNSAPSVSPSDRKGTRVSMKPSSMARTR